MKGLSVKDYVEYRDYDDNVQRGFILDIGRDSGGYIYLEVQNVSSDLQTCIADADDYICKVKFDSTLCIGDIEFLIDLALNTNDVKWLQELGILLSVNLKK
jgi:hypothetical protein